MQVRNMTLPELEQILDWAASEGWNPGHDDGAAFYKTDPNGYFVASEKGGRLVAAISVVKYDETNGFLGLYICHPDFRGNGIGLSVWNAGMQYLDGMSVGLDGVVAQQSNYQRSGFELAYRNIRFQGIYNHSIDINAVVAEYANQGIHCQQIETSHLSALHALDHATHGINRRAFLDNWLTDTEHRKSLVCINGDKVLGVGTVRQCRECLKIGPLMATDPDVARLLIDSLLGLFEEKEVMIDIPEPNKAAVELVEAIGFSSVFETARMYRGKFPEYQLDKLYGVSTFELG